MTAIEKLRALKENLHKEDCGIPKNKKVKQEKLDLKDPEKLPNSQYKYYLVWKKHHALKHRVLRMSNGVMCYTCDMIHRD